MRLVALTIKNFRVLRHASLIFPDQVVGIIGPNGAGKSSIVEAVAWALYGNRVVRSGKEEIRSAYAAAGEDTLVCLEFELGQERYQLTRQLIGRRGRSEVTLNRNDRPESAGSTETEHYIAQLLGLDWRGFLTSFLARQQELNALADLAPGQRRDHLAGMLGIDRLDTALRRVREERRILQQTALSYEQQQGHLDIVNRELIKLGEHARHLERQQDSLSGAQTAAEAALSETSRLHREHEALKTTCSQLQARLDSVVGSRRPLQQHLDDLCSQEKRLAAAQVLMLQLQGETGNLDLLKAERTDLEKAETSRSQLDELQRQAAELDRQLSEVGQIIVGRQAEAVTIRKQLDDIPTGVVERLAETRAQLEEARAEWMETRSEHRAQEVAVANLTEQMNSIDEVGPEAICERCRRPFGDDLQQIREHLHHELAELTKVMAELAVALTAHRRKGDQLKEAVVRLEALVQSQRDAEVRREPLQREIDTLVARRTTLKDQQAAVTGRIDQLGEVSYDSGRLKNLKEEVERLESVAARVLELKGELTRLDDVRAGLTGVRDQLSQLDAEAAETNKQLESLGFDVAAAARISEELAVRQQAFDQARMAALNGAKELEIALREIKAREEELARLAEAGLRLEEVRTDQFYAEKLVSLFADFRKHTISRIRPRLAELSSELISEMSGGRYSLVDLDEDYNLQIMDSGRYFGVDRFSGGEKDLASLCLRLAISLALTESAGLERSFVILDEVFGSQDTSRRELILQALANLKERFPQMILVTHLEELKHKVETLVELVPQPGGWSEVRVNGEVA